METQVGQFPDQEIQRVFVLGEDQETFAPTRDAVERVATGEESGGTPNQEILLDFLRNSQPTPAAKALLKRTMQQFVLDYGWWYEPAELPKHVALGTPQECHKNAMDLVTADDSLIYCEGCALFKGSSLPTVHTWVTDGRGAAIDSTWPQTGVAYAGVPFRVGFVTTTALKNDAIGSLLDDYMNDFPLRGDLGDRPDEWLEPRGVERQESAPSRTPNELEMPRRHGGGAIHWQSFSHFHSWCLQPQSYCCENGSGSSSCQGSGSWMRRMRIPTLTTLLTLIACQSASAEITKIWLTHRTTTPARSS